MRTSDGKAAPHARLTSSRQRLKSGSSWAAHSANASTRSSGVEGSRTIWMIRVKASSSTTMRVPATLNLRVDLQCCQDARVHVVGADEHGKLDDLLLVEVR